MENNSGLHPAGDRILVLPDPVEEVTQGGIVIPETERSKFANAQTIGVLVAVGPDAWTHYVEKSDKGTLVRGFSKDFATPGQRVMFARYAGVEFEGLDGSQYKVLNDVDITGTVDEEVTNNNLQSRKRVE